MGRMCTRLPQLDQIRSVKPDGVFRRSATDRATSFGGASWLWHELKRIVLVVCVDARHGQRRIGVMLLIE